MSDVSRCPSCERYFDSTFKPEECPHCNANIQVVFTDDHLDEGPAPTSPLNWIGVVIPALLSFPWELLRGFHGSQAFVLGRFIGLAVLFAIPTIAAMIARRMRFFRSVWGLIFGLSWFGVIILTIILVLLFIPIGFPSPG